MGTSCSRCGVNLPRLRLFRVTCGNCGAKYKAVRNQDLSWVSGVYGALAFIAIPLGLFSPVPFWLKVTVLPLLYIAGGIGIAIAIQRWQIANK